MGTSLCSARKVEEQLLVFLNCLQGCHVKDIVNFSVYSQYVQEYEEIDADKELSSEEDFLISVSLTIWSHEEVIMVDLSYCKVWRLHDLMWRLRWMVSSLNERWN